MNCVLTRQAEKILLSRMRILIAVVLLLCAVVSPGCARKSKRPPQEAAAHDRAFAPVLIDKTNVQSALAITPESTLVGKVATVNTIARFVVLSFAPGRLPPIDQHLNLYRKGLKVGEVKVTGPQTDENTVADLLAGEAEIGDEARDK
jgi:hypothetical protein